MQIFEKKVGSNLWWKKAGCQYPRIQIVLNIEKKSGCACSPKKGRIKNDAEKMQDLKFLPCPP